MIESYCIFISAHLPTPNIPIAGQKIAYKNLKKLCETHKVILIAFINGIEEQYFDESIYEMCYKTHFIRINMFDRVKSLLFHPYRPLRVSPRYQSQIVALVHKYTDTLNITLFHAEYTATMAYIGCFESSISTEVVEHDVVFQSLERLCKSRSFLSKIFYCFEYEKQKKWELAALKNIDKVIVLNEKDKALLLEKKIENIEVAFPEVDEWILAVDRSKYEKNTILFLGAMNRFENQDAIMWFVKDILPLLKNKIPDIKLYIVGGNPPENILQLASDNVTVTGFVESLQVYFEKVNIAVVPLRYGAGVKIKTLETLAAKIPTVSTVIGAEGIPENKMLYLANTEEDYVEVITSLLGKQKNV